MERKWREFFLLWSKTDEYLNRVEQTKERVKEIKRRCVVPAIMFSGGKDSTVGLHLSLQQIPDLLVFHYDYFFNIPREIAEEIIKNLKRLGAKNYEIYMEKRNLSDDRGFFTATHKFIKKHNVSCVISCLRAQESNKRKALTSKSGQFFGAHNIHIIRDWSWKDVWAYIISNNLPYPRIYNEYAKLEGWDKVRFTAFFTPDLEYLGKENIDKHVLWRKHHEMEVYK